MSLFNKKRKDLPRRRDYGAGSTQAFSSNTFKRNRTLTGSTSNNLNSINADADLESPRKHTHKLANQRRKVMSILAIVIASIVLILITFNNFTASSSISVSDMTISKPVVGKKYEAVIKDYFDANPMSRFSLFQDQALLADYITNKLPEVSSIKRKSTFLGRTNFNITMRSPVAGWQINNKQYFVDSMGVPFETNYYSTPLVQIIDNSGVNMQKGVGAIASHRFLAFVGRVVYFARLNGYVVTQAILPANTTRELDIKLKNASYFIKLSIDRPAGEQVEDMTSAVRYFISRQQNPQYIDVRVSGKATYRF